MPSGYPHGIGTAAADAWVDFWRQNLFMGPGPGNNGTLLLLFCPGNHYYYYFGISQSHYYYYFAGKSHYYCYFWLKMPKFFRAKFPQIFVILAQKMFKNFII